VGPGASRDEALNAYGWPTGQSQSGTKEILTYPQGRIYLEKGRVERVDFSPEVAWPAPRPRPGAPTTTAGKKPVAPDEFWVTDWAAAAADARTRRARVLALFTGSDWSPGSQKFQSEVALEPDFLNAFVGDYVFLKVDFPSRQTLPEALRAQNAQLRGRYEVKTYPALLVLSPGGMLLARVDLENLPPGDTYRARVIAALAGVRRELAAKPPPPDPVEIEASGAGGVRKTDTARAGPATGTTQLAASLSSASWLLATSLIGGLALVVLAWWWLWRRGSGAGGGGGRAAEREEQAASAEAATLSADATTWSKQQVCRITAKLCEAEGYRVVVRPAGGDVDFALMRTGDEAARVLVWCLPAAAGRANKRRVRELFASITLDGVGEGWLVAPGGAEEDARALAAEKQITLIDAAELAERLDALPPLARIRMLGSG